MKILMGLFLIAVLFSPWQSGGAQKSEPAEPWFAVTINTAKPVITIGTDVKLKVIFANKTNQGISVSAGAPGRDFDLDVRDGEGRPVPETAYGLKMHGEVPTPGNITVYRRISLPGDKFEEELDLSKEYDLSSPGKYTVQLRGRNPKFRAVKSNTITFALVHPMSGAENRE
jgi:hypothetical protein